ncbi:MAG TPA: hypothetical protein VHO94_04700 [Oscillospiraceae bacterium]|nr:hypothetical protein [Oscillospiraceae bacterium]
MGAIFPNIRLPIEPAIMAADVLFSPAAMLRTLSALADCFQKAKKFLLSLFLLTGGM